MKKKKKTAPSQPLELRRRESTNQRESTKDNLRIQTGLCYRHACSGNGVMHSSLRSSNAPATERMLPTAWTHTPASILWPPEHYCCFVFLTKLRPGWGLRQQNSSTEFSERVAVESQSRSLIHERHGGATSPAGLQNNMNQLVMRQIGPIISLMSLIKLTG